MKTTNSSQLQRRSTSTAGFTLIEIILVIVIISVLAGGTIKMLTGNVDVAKETRVEGDLSAMTSQLQLYEARSYRMPTTEQGLMALVARPTADPQPDKWNQLLKELPMDPWGKAYSYKSPGERSGDKYDLYSCGPDGIDGNEDDIGNWKRKPAAE